MFILELCFEVREVLGLILLKYRDLRGGVYLLRMVGDCFRRKGGCWVVEIMDGY